MLLYIVLQDRKAKTLQSGDTFCIHIDVPCKVWCNLITGRSFNLISPPNWILSRIEYLIALSRRMSSHSRKHPLKHLIFHTGDNRICLSKLSFRIVLICTRRNPSVHVFWRNLMCLAGKLHLFKPQIIARDLLVLFFVFF